MGADNENNDFIYDVAFSFAGEQRDFVSRVYMILTDKYKLKVFYDQDPEIQAKLWGKDFTEEFPKVYGEQSKWCLLFISKEYKEKYWTTYEKRIVLAKAIKEKGDYLLPARFDDTEIPGILSTVGYINVSQMSPDEFSEKIMLRLVPSKHVKAKKSKLSIYNESKKNNKKNLAVIGIAVLIFVVLVMFTISSLMDSDVRSDSNTVSDSSNTGSGSFNTGLDPSNTGSNSSNTGLDSNNESDYNTGSYYNTEPNSDTVSEVIGITLSDLQRIQEVEYESNAWKNQKYSSVQVGDKYYVPLKPDLKNKFAELVLDDGYKYTVRTGEFIDLGEGYSVQIKQVDIDGTKVWVEFYRNGEYVDDEIVGVGTSDSTWDVKLDGIQGENNVTVMKIHINQIEADGIQIDGLWVIDYANAFSVTG
jgi:S-layer protein (TIGR01567 family)